MAIVGCGAVGSYYGAMLCRAGQETHFLLRSDYDVVRRDGVQIRTAEGDFTVHPRCAKRPEEISTCDAVLIALKTTANDQFPDLLPPLVGPHTVVVTLQNGLGNEDQLARLFPVEQIMGGLCFVCLNRIAPGVINHMAHGMVVLGEFKRPPQQRTRDLATLFQHAGVNCKVSDNLERAHWEKLVWNVPFNGLGVAGIAGHEVLVAPPGAVRVQRSTSNIRPSCLTTDKLLGDARWENLVRELMTEVRCVAGALGHEIPERFADNQVERTRVMGAYKASTLIDFERGLPLELDSLFLEPLRQARGARVPTPRLEALCSVLSSLDQR